MRRMDALSTKTESIARGLRDRFPPTAAPALTSPSNGSDNQKAENVLGRVAAPVIVGPCVITVIVEVRVPGTMMVDWPVG